MPLCFHNPGPSGWMGFGTVDASGVRGVSASTLSRQLLLAVIRHHLPPGVAEVLDQQLKPINAVLDEPKGSIARSAQDSPEAFAAGVRSVRAARVIVVNDASFKSVPARPATFTCPDTIPELCPRLAVTGLGSHSGFGQQPLCALLRRGAGTIPARLGCLTSTAPGLEPELSCLGRPELGQRLDDAAPGTPFLSSIRREPVPRVRCAVLAVWLGFLTAPAVLRRFWSARHPCSTWDIRYQPGRTSRRTGA